MNSERWERIQNLFEAALAQPDELRSVFIASACGDDVELHDEVTSLLAIRLRSKSQQPHEPHQPHELIDLVQELPTGWLATLARPKPPRFNAGERIAGRYLVQRLLGRGGMGEVYEAWDEDLSIPVALKTLQLTGTERVLQRLKLESLLARSVSHPNVCRVYDLSRHDEGKATTWFLTMELLHGETLAERLRKERLVPADRAQGLAEQMAAGLGAAHQAGVVHRDFKTDNVMLVGQGAAEQAIVMDFGVSRATSENAVREDREAGDGGIYGTLAYMAPEQMHGEAVGPAADIYALGIVLYELVTGRLPFTGSSSIEAAKRRLNEEAPSPRTFVPELDERWETVILRCLAREPRRRFERAEEVAEALAGRLTLGGVVEPLVPTPRVRHTLPAERDAFVGREMEIADLKRHLAGSHLVTLLGAGGMGKTRLAVRYGWETRGEWPGGVWFCDLTEARSLDGIATAIAGPLGVQLGREDPIAQLGHAIAGRGRCLMILDNFEQVAEHAAATVGRWMERAKEARYVVTSRERLGLGEEEKVQGVEPLSIEQGMKLFEARARWLRPGLELSGSEAESVREIVGLVDGMPLAIELAATRMRVMSAAQIASQMRKRFQLLTGGRSARHETLAVAIDGSWELLQPWEKAAWAQCAVFEGGFTLEASEAIVSLSAWREAPWVVDVIQSLVDKSLLRTWIPSAGQEGGFSELRFGMYVSLQEYARMKLREEGAIERGGSGREAERSAEVRHGQWYGHYGTRETSAPTYIDLTALRRVLGRELENLMAACRRACDRGDGNTAADAFHVTSMIFTLRGPFNTAVELGRRIIAEVHLESQLRARFLNSLAQAEWYSGDLEAARAHYQAALAISREAGARFLESVVLEGLGSLQRTLGEMDAAGSSFEMSIAIAREIGDRRGEGISLGNLGIVHREQGRVIEARACYAAALAIHREVGNQHSEGILLSNLGNLDRLQGRMEEARANHEAALAIHRQVGNRRSEGHVLGSLGNLYYDLGRLDSACSHYEAALAIHREVGDRRFEGITRNFLGCVRLQLGQLEEAEGHCQAALAIVRETGSRRVEASVLGTLGNLRRAQGRFVEARCIFEDALFIAVEMRNRTFEGTILGSLGSLLHHSGHEEEARVALTRGEAILRQTDARLELAKVLCLRAEFELEKGDVGSLAATLHEAEELAVEVGVGPESEVGQMVAKVRQALGVTQ